MQLTCCSTFLNKLLNFAGVGFALYSIASLYEWMSKDSIIKHTVKCRYCRKRISEKVCLPVCSMPPSCQELRLHLEAQASWTR